MSGAKEYLDQIRLLDKRIDRKIEEKEVLKSLATSTGSMSMNPDKVQSSINLHKTEDAITKYVDLEKEIDRMIDELVLLRDRIINEIHQIDDVRYEELLCLKYVGRLDENTDRIHYLRLEEIACVMKKSNGDHYSFDHIAHLHGEALQKFWESHSNHKS